MKEVHQYNTNFKEEYQKAIQFLKKGCKCRCSFKLPKEKFAQIRGSFQTLSKKEQDIFLMAQFLNTSGGEASLSKRLKKKERENQRTFYQWDHNIPICLETYLNMLGVSWTFLKNTRNHLKDHFLNKGSLTRTHGNTGKIPFRKTKMFIDETIREEVKKFLESYAREHGQPDPSQRYAKKISVEVRSSGEVIFLPTEMSYKSVHHDFVISFERDDKLKSLKYEAFRRLWHELAPNIKIRSPRSDLCDACHKFRNEIHSCKDETTKQSQKKNLSNTRKEPN